MSNFNALMKQLEGLKTSEMFENDFLLTWEKSNDEIAATFAVADALRDLRERNISS